MKKLFFFFLMLIASGCGSNALHLTKINRIEMVYDEQRNLNYGDTLSIRFYAVKNSGERIDITASHQLRIRGEGIDYNRQDGVLYIDRKPTRPDNYDVDFRTVLYHKKDSLSFNQLIRLNFKGPLYVDFRGESGEEGRGRVDRIGTGLLSDGARGRKGKDGEDGKDAQPIVARVKKQGSYYYVQVKDIHSNTYYYQSETIQGLTIDVSGGHGGRGGDGGDGARGKNGDASKDRLPGNGGDGGDGGNGGNGGNGAALEVIFHPNVESELHHVRLLNVGGKGGRYGIGGEGGRAGRPDTEQEQPNDGQKGKPGTSGKNGQPGPEVIIQVEVFDF
jgi:hypothetical protein